MNEKPSHRILISVQRFGVLSEVWMYRQATLMQDCEVHVVCKLRENLNSYPDHGCQTWVYPKASFISRGLRCVFRNWVKRGTGSPNPGRSEIEWLENRLLDIDPLITLFHYGTNATKYAPLFQKLNRPYAVHFNGYDLSKMLKQENYQREIVDAAKHAKALIVVARYMYDWLTEKGVDEDKIHYLPYGVPLNNFQHDDSITKNENCTFLMVGRLTPKKAPDLSIQAFANCLKSCPNAKLRIIGSGELEDSCRKLVSSFGISNSVYFLGAQPTKTVLEEMRSASVFVQHSLTPASGDKEGWPVAVAEAAASGLPIISTNHASIPEQVLHGQTGLLCDEGDWQAMAKHMTQLATDQEKLIKFGEASKRHISQWDAQGQIDKLSNILKLAANS